MRVVAMLVRVSVVALLAGLLQVVVAAPASATVPTGAVDIFDSPEPGRVRVAGWAIDPDQPGAFVTIHVYVGGQGINIGEAKLSRPDVGATYPSAGDLHGFDRLLDFAVVGDQPRAVYGIDTRGGDPALLSGPAGSSSPTRRPRGPSSRSPPPSTARSTSPAGAATPTRPRHRSRSMSTSGELRHPRRRAPHLQHQRPPLRRQAGLQPATDNDQDGRATRLRLCHQLPGDTGQSSADRTTSGDDLRRHHGAQHQDHLSAGDRDD
ncbi:hypothetical protein [Nocardioides sp. B-3]|uniref:hypothetical protein n=1 Tax=Nocardioides sp. B-3 TaxID=2895565 RepID=UPI0021529780|nr:hypothetical protein [Nocardioides sp. B-3]UUZ61434.1 hypothetical protein LP418_13180 [Nocardioides sp. B-3]